jgi:hypothetical protein
MPFLVVMPRPQAIAPIIPRLWVVGLSGDLYQIVDFALGTTQPGPAFPLNTWRNLPPQTQNGVPLGSHTAWLVGGQWDGNPLSSESYTIYTLAVDPATGTGTLTGVWVPTATSFDDWIGGPALSLLSDGSGGLYGLHYGGRFSGTTAMGYHWTGGGTASTDDFYGYSWSRAASATDPTVLVNTPDNFPNPPGFALGDWFGSAGALFYWAGAYRIVGFGHWAHATANVPAFAFWTNTGSPSKGEDWTQVSDYYSYYDLIAGWSEFGMGNTVASWLCQPLVFGSYCYIANGLTFDPSWGFTPPFSASVLAMDSSGGVAESFVLPVSSAIKSGPLVEHTGDLYTFTMEGWVANNQAASGTATCRLYQLTSAPGTWTEIASHTMTYGEWYSPQIGAAFPWHDWILFLPQTQRSATGVEWVSGGGAWNVVHGYNTVTDTWASVAVNAHAGGTATYAPYFVLPDPLL